MLYSLQDDLNLAIKNINNLNIGVGTKQGFKRQINNSKKQLIINNKAPKRIINEYKSIDLSKKEFYVQIGEQKTFVEVILENDLNICITYKPSLKFLGDTSSEGEYLPNNFATLNLCKALVYPKTGKNQRIKIVKAISELWD